MTIKLSDGLPDEAEIIGSWDSVSGTPMVSIRCATYNHSAYIERAIKGFLIQKTSFPIEIWIHDDASTDGTREIIESYQNSYPRIIKTILQKENQYSKLVKPGILLAKKCTGKYIAVCEGDDYWTDPFKLQKQVDFLEANPDYVISGHNARIIDQEGNVVLDSKLPDNHKRDYSAKEVQEGRAFILTLSWVYRKVLADDVALAERSVVKNGDTFLLSLLGQYGAAHYHDDIQPAVYRAHEGGVWSLLDERSRLRAHVTTSLMVANYYQRVGQHEMADFWWSKVDRFMSKRLSIAGLLREALIRLTFARTILMKSKAQRAALMGRSK